MQSPTIAILGGTGRFGAPFIREFLAQGVRVRLLARSPESVARRYPRAEVHRGTMLSYTHLKHALQRVSAAFLITPVGANGDVGIELTAARQAIAAARDVRLPHLIYLSLIQPLPATGVPLLDVKGRIDTLLKESRLPFSSLRTGCYMDTWLSFFPAFMRMGLYLMPVGSRHRFSFTAQRDVARLATRLMRSDRILHHAVDVIDPTAHSIADVVGFYQAAGGKKMIALGRWLLPILTLLRPMLLRWLFPKEASRIDLFNYFNTHDWIGDPHRLTHLLPGFRVTTMAAYLRNVVAGYTWGSEKTVRAAEEARRTPSGNLSQGPPGRETRCRTNEH